MSASTESVTAAAFEFVTTRRPPHAVAMNVDDGNMINRRARLRDRWKRTLVATSLIGDCVHRCVSDAPNAVHTEFHASARRFLQ
jgi:hypothetical protein